MRLPQTGLSKANLIVTETRGPTGDKASGKDQRTTVELSMKRSKRRAMQLKERYRARNGEGTSEHKETRIDMPLPSCLAKEIKRGGKCPRRITAEPVFGSWL